MQLKNKKLLSEVSLYTVLVFPPERIHYGKCCCRYEPDGLAIINGYLKSLGYRYSKLVFSEYVDKFVVEKERKKNPYGWSISDIDQEGVSFRNIVNRAIKCSMNSLTVIQLKKLISNVALSTTGIVGFSIGFPSQLYYAIILARIVKKINNNAFIVFGGPIITSYIKFVSQLKEIISIVDGLVPGFGEVPLAKLILALEKKGDIDAVPNLYLSKIDVFKQNEVDWLPDKTNLLIIPDYDRKSLVRINDPFFPVRPSIGCYWGKCAFCIYPSMPTGRRLKRKYIAVDPCELVMHLKCLIENGGGKKYELCSDSLPPLYLEKLAEEMIKNKLDIKWNAWSCLDKKFLGKNVLKLLRESGCESMLIGLESVSQKTLQRINKLQSYKDIDVVLNAFHDANISLFLTVCIGFPGETFDDAIKTIEYLKNLIERKIINRKNVRIYRFALMCNTEVYENYKYYGISSIDYDDLYYLDDDFTYYYKVSGGMSFEEIRDFVFKYRRMLNVPTDDSFENYCIG